MAGPFDPRKVLRQTSGILLKEFFARRNEMNDVDWEKVTSRNIEPLYEEYQKLDNKAQNEIQIILHDLSLLSDHRGISVLVEEIRDNYPEKTAEFEALKNSADKAMWAYLNIHDSFSEVLLFARADTLAAGRYWVKRNGLPVRKIAVSKEIIKNLQNGLTEFYGSKQLRGRVCKVEHYTRKGGAEYFFAYLDDYPDQHMVLENNKLIMRADKSAFQNVFVYNSNEGTMETYAGGGKKVRQPLEKIFCKAIFDEEIDTAKPIEPAYKLDHLAKADCPLPTEPVDGISEVKITSLRIEPIGGGGSIELKVDPSSPKGAIYRKYERWIQGKNLPVKSICVTRATFKITFVQTGAGRPKTLSFSVGSPNSCDLKSKPDEMRIVGERCLKLWKVVDDDE